jgi:hypothetical protein
LAPSEAWHEIASYPEAFLNGWHDAGNGWASAAYYVDPLGIFHLRGSIAGGTVAASPDGIAFYVPAPDGKEAFATASATAGGTFVPAEVTIVPGWPPGAPVPTCVPIVGPSLYGPGCSPAQVRIDAGANARVSLDGIAWRVTPQR